MRPAPAVVLVLAAALAAGSGVTSATASPADVLRVTTCAEPATSSGTGGWALGVDRLSDPCLAELRNRGSAWR